MSFAAGESTGRLSGFPAERFALAGDPAAIGRSAHGWSQFGGQASGSAADIRSLDTTLFVGPEGDQYRDGLRHDLAARLDTTGHAYADVGAALGHFASVLAGLQDRMRPWAVCAPNRWDDLEFARAGLAAARSADAQQAEQMFVEQLPWAGGGPPPVHHSSTVAAMSSLSRAQQAWDEAVSAADRIRTEHAAAVSDCAAAIERASTMRFARNPGGLSGFVHGATGFVRDQVQGLASLAGRLKDAAVAAALFVYNASVPVVNAALSLANAVASDPSSALQVLAGLSLMSASADLEAIGGLLDVTGIGAVVGVPIGIVATAGLVTGFAVAAPAAGNLLDEARGADRVDVMHSTSPVKSSGSVSGAQTKLDAADRGQVDLRAEEDAGGHTIERHVDMTRADLVARNKAKASTFADLSTAERSVARNLSLNRSKIESWLKTDKQTLRIQAETGTDDGIVYIRESRTFAEPHNVVSELVRDGDGFRIQTSYLED